MLRNKLLHVLLLPLKLRSAVFKKASNHSITVFSGQPVVPLDESEVHVKSCGCSVPPEALDVLLIRTPGSLNVLCMRPCLWMHKVLPMVDLIMDVTILQQSLIHSPTICDKNKTNKNKLLKTKVRLN